MAKKNKCMIQFHLTNYWKNKKVGSKTVRLASHYTYLSSRKYGRPKLAGG